MAFLFQNAKGELVDCLVFLKTITFKKICNGLLLRVSYLLSKIFGVYIHWGRIESLSVEPTNLCNLNCPECPSGNNAMSRPRMFLSLNNFENVISEFSGHLTYLQLFFQGEPFLHPKLFDMVKMASEKNIYTSVSTNGQFFSKNNCQKIVTSGLHRLIVSCDGTTQQTYEQYRVGGSFDLVVKGINELMEVKRQLKSATPVVIMQFVVFASNEHQIGDVKKLANQLKVDKLEIKSAQIDDFEAGNELIPRNTKYSRYHKNNSGNYILNRKNDFKCKRVWYGAVVTAENKIVPCCFDKNGDFEYKRVGNQTIHDAWTGSGAENFRKRVWSLDETINICKNCTEGLK